MPLVKVGTRINLQKAQQRRDRNQKIINFLYFSIFGTLATYGLLELIFQAHGL